MEANETTVGAEVSTTSAFEPAMLFDPVGTAVLAMALPAVSRTVPTVKLETVRSALLSPDAMVYVPVKAVLAVAAVSVTVAPLFSVATMLPPDRTVSLIVAEMVMLCVAR